MLQISRQYPTHGLYPTLKTITGPSHQTGEVLSLATPNHTKCLTPAYPKSNLIVSLQMFSI